VLAPQQMRGAVGEVDGLRAVVEVCAVVLDVDDARPVLADPAGHVLPPCGARRTRVGVRHVVEAGGDLGAAGGVAAVGPEQCDVVLSGDQILPASPVATQDPSGGGVEQCRDVGDGAGGADVGGRGEHGNPPAILSTHNVYSYDRECMGCRPTPSTRAGSTTTPAARSRPRSRDGGFWTPPTGWSCATATS